MTKLPPKLLNNPLTTLRNEMNDLEECDNDIVMNEISLDPSIPPLIDDNLDPDESTISKIPSNISKSNIYKNKLLANNLVKDLNLCAQYVAYLKVNHSSESIFNSEINISRMKELQNVCTDFQDFILQKANHHGISLGPPNTSIRSGMSNISKSETAKLIATEADRQIRDVLAPKKVQSHVNVNLPTPRPNQNKYIKNLTKKMVNCKRKHKSAYHQDENKQQQMRDDYFLKCEEVKNQIEEIKKDESVDIRIAVKRNLYEVADVTNPKPKRIRITRSSNSGQDG